MCATALTAQLSLALCYWWGGGGWYYLQPRSWGLGSSWTRNPCPRACPGQGSASGTCVQHSQYLPSSATQPQVCWSAANWDLCRFMSVICNKKKTSCPWCAPCKGLCPTPTSQSNCKTKPWTPWESGAKPTVHGLGTDKDQTSKTPPSCWAFLLQHLPWYHCQAQDSTELSYLSGHAGSCAPVSTASHPVLQCQSCQEGQQEPPAQGDRHTGDCSVKEVTSFMDWLCSITRV